MHEKKYSCCQLFDTVYKNYLCAEILVWRYSPKISQFSWKPPDREGKELLHQVFNYFIFLWQIYSLSLKI